ncbi:Hypothetical predicted protein [Podarcis lilfordi]|uniref:Uncharacterized protein n=1 Tax=Podarcis lilfordi TaxID=74358 RepID=A0AA35JQE6_9SAUR|nr:Hypothetical predicted protein [Podarcis lilfordi]
MLLEGIKSPPPCFLIFLATFPWMLSALILAKEGRQHLCHWITSADIDSDLVLPLPRAGNRILFLQWQQLLLPLPRNWKKLVSPPIPISDHGHELWQELVFPTIQLISLPHRIDECIYLRSDAYASTDLLGYLE